MMKPISILPPVLSFGVRKPTEEEIKAMLADLRRASSDGSHGDVAGLEEVLKGLGVDNRRTRNAFSEGAGGAYSDD